MKKFVVDSKVFEIFPDYCLGVVVAEGIDNENDNLRINNFFENQIKYFLEEYSLENIREIENIKAYRDAFKILGMNQNKYMCSIEALAKRVQKSGRLPFINPIVNLGNALSLKYVLPIGAHDVYKLNADMEIRFSIESDHFRGMGENQEEVLPPKELIYVSGHTVKTRRWIWRQSEDGKITPETNYVLFPIDGFENINSKQVLKARDELASIIQEEYHCKVKTGYINKYENTFTL
ncbi:MAG: B3/4 domain-containing protein [Thomasclavelia sp.]